METVVGFVVVSVVVLVPAPAALEDDNVPEVVLPPAPVDVKVPLAPALEVEAESVLVPPTGELELGFGAGSEIDYKQR
jgi:hypothetical protein